MSEAFEDAYVDLPEKPVQLTRIPVTLLMLDDGQGYSVVITEDSPIRCFRLPVGHHQNTRKFLVDPTDREVVEVDLKPLRQLVSNEILPNKDIIVDNVVKSFLRQRVYVPSEVKKLGGKALRTAFPYRIEREVEE